MVLGPGRRGLLASGRIGQFGLNPLYEGHYGYLSATFFYVRCPTCGSEETRVVDSRSVEDGWVIRRRRLCGDCSGRFNTFERTEVTRLMVRKQSGDREPFEREKILHGMASAAKGRPIDDGVFELLADEIEERARIEGGEVTSEWVGLAVLERLQAVDQVACLRFASVYKGFTEIGDFEREARLIKLDTR